MNKQYTYSDAFDELQNIVSEIERGEISIDELAEKVKRAALLINICKAKLTATEEEVNSILANLTAETVAGQAPAPDSEGKNSDLANLSTSDEDD